MVTKHYLKLYIMNNKNKKSNRKKFLNKCNCKYLKQNCYIDSKFKCLLKFCKILIKGRVLDTNHRHYREQT